MPDGSRAENRQTVGEAARVGMPTGGELFASVWRQVREGLDEDRLLPSREKRTNDLRKKLDKPLDQNGWRMFVSGLAYTMENGKARQKRSAEIMLVETVTRWRAQVLELLPERERDLVRLVQAGLVNPAPPLARD